MLSVKVYLIQPPIKYLENPCSNQPVGIIQIYTLLKAIGVDVTFLDCRKDETYVPFDGGMYMFSASSLEMGYVDKIASIMKEHNPKARTVLGGIHVNSLLKSRIWSDKNIIDEHPDIDVFVGGYYQSEEDVKSLMDCVCHHNNKRIIIKPLTIKGDFNIVPLDFRCLKYNMTTDSKLMRNEAEGYKAQNITMNLGCPQNCSFCANPCRKIYKSNVEKLIVEMIRRKNLYDVKAFKINDDDILVNEKWINEFLDQAVGLDFKYIASTRADLSIQKWKTDAIKKFQAIGLEKIGIGVESASNEVLKNINKKLTIENIKESISILSNHDIEIMVYMIYGLMPLNDKTVNEFCDFIYWCKDKNVSILNVTQLVPFPGSDIYDKCDRYCGYVNRVRYPDNEYTWNHSCFVGQFGEQYIHCLPRDITQENYIKLRTKVLTSLKDAGYLRKEAEEDRRIK